MPFSFIEIEQKKTRIIGLLFVFIIFCYFLTAYLLLVVLENAFVMETEKSGFQWPSFDHTLMAFGFAFIVAVIHWSISTSNLIEKISYPFVCQLFQAVHSLEVVSAMAKIANPASLLYAP